MKKLMTCLLAALCVFGVAGCEKVAEYKAGTYTATATDNYNNENNVASARVVVDENGKIESVYLDTTYTTSDGTETTKKALGNDYNMMTYNPSASGEWFEQVEKLEAAIVENQGIDFLTVDEEGYIDAVSGCTIKVDALVEAVTAAINQAK